MPAERPQVYLFGPFRLNARERILERDGIRMALTPKVIDTLLVLVERVPQVVTKEELMQAVWPGLSVAESGLTRNISSLRKALEEGGAEGSYLETIPKRGYRFIAEVRLVEAPAPSRRLPWWPLAVVAGLVLVWLLLPARRAPAPVDPSVRIGEHLLYKLAPEQTLRASDEFRRAIAAHPDSAAAHAGLSISLMQTAMFGLRPHTELLGPASESVARALALDPGLATAHYAAGLLALVRDWDFAKSEAEFQRALELDPRSVQVRLGYARLKLAAGGPEQALPLVEEALRLDPASPPLGVEYCRVFYFRRDFQRAESECRKVLEREPGYTLARYYLALSLGFLDRLEEGRRMLAEAGLAPGVTRTDLAWLSLRGGDRRPAVEALAAIREMIGQGKIDSTAKLLLAASLGEFAEAREALETGLRTRAPELLTVPLEPRLDVLKNDPACVALLARISSPQR